MPFGPAKRLYGLIFKSSNIQDTLPSACLHLSGLKNFAGRHSLEKLYG